MKRKIKGIARKVPCPLMSLDTDTLSVIGSCRVRLVCRGCAVGVSVWWWDERMGGGGGGVTCALPRPINNTAMQVRRHIRD